MTPRAMRWIARLAYVEAQHHLSVPASWNEHASPHVVRRLVTEGYRLMDVANRAAKDAIEAEERGE